MAAPRPYRLELEAFEERTLPSGGFGGNDRQPESRGWDANPARTRTLDDPRGPQAPGGDRGANTERAQAFTAPQALAVVVMFDRPAVVPVREVGAAASLAQQAAAVVSAAQPGGAGAIQMPPATGRPVAPNIGAVPTDVRPDRPPAPTPPVSAERASAAPVLVMFGTSDERAAFDGPAAVPAAPVLEPSVAPPPRPTIPPLHEWLPIEIDVPVPAPLAGLLKVNAAGIEAGAQRLLELTTGIEVEGDSGGWWLWLAVGAALAGGAGYAAWANRRSPRAPWGGSDDSRIG